MSNKKTVKNEVMVEYLSKFPDMPSMTLAKLAHKERPKLYPTSENARSIVRYLRGTSGDQKKTQQSDKRFVLPAPTEENPLSLPEGELQNFKPYTIPLKYKKGLVLADAHIPYHDTRALSLAIQYGQQEEVDFVWLGGDIADFYRISRFQQDPECRTFKEELTAIRHFLMALKDALPNAKIIYKEGNHENRYTRYLRNNAEAFIGVTEYRLEVLLHLYPLDIEWVDGKRPIHFGKLNLMHGDEWAGGGAGGVNPARSFFLKAKECVLGCHFHRTSFNSEPTLNGRDISCWSIGCLCDLHPEYMPLNKWNHGFAVISRTDDNWFHVDSKRIIQGKIV